MLAEFGQHLYWVLGIAEFLFRLCAVIFSAHAIMNVRTSQGTIAWVISMLIFPYLAVPLYLIFGRRKFHGYAQDLNQARKHINLAFREKIFSQLAAYHSKRDPKLFPFQKCAERLLKDFHFTDGNHSELLIDGDETYAAIYKGIEAAKKYILVQFFIVRDDDTGREFRDHLIDKARRGIQIYFLYDEIGCHALEESFWKPLIEAGAKVSAFHTTRGRGNRLQINFRNHRKIVVVDGVVAFIGGLNLADEYRGRESEFGHWRDTFVRIDGPAAQFCQISFSRDWHWATHEVLPQKITWKVVPHKANERCMIMPIGPGDEFTSGVMMMAELIHAAHKRLWIASPYFVPESTIMHALQAAALRGVDVRILLPKHPDHKLVYWCSFAYYDSLAKTDIKLYRYREGFMHQKIILVDDKMAGVGTTNLDTRSLRLNFEIMAIFASPRPVQAVEKMLERDIQSCDLVDLQDYDKKPYWFRLRARLAKLFDTIL